jgi:hypothetical protein
LSLAVALVLGCASSAFAQDGDDLKGVTMRVLDDVKDIDAVVLDIDGDHDDGADGDAADHEGRDGHDGEANDGDHDRGQDGDDDDGEDGDDDDLEDGDDEEHGEGDLEDEDVERDHVGEEPSDGDHGTGADAAEGA